MNGYESLKAAVMRDCNEVRACGCFSPDECTRKCDHRYCDKFKWVIDRAKHYGEKLGIPWDEVLNSWEAERSYWYMNYYQESNQPRIGGDRVRVFDRVEDLLAAIGKDGFRCPCCGGISSSPYECDSGIVRSDGKVCDWKVYGLFRGLGKDVFVYCKDRVRGERMFMPVAWEKEESHG